MNDEEIKVLKVFEKWGLDYMHCKEDNLEIIKEIIKSLEDEKNRR